MYAQFLANILFDSGYVASTTLKIVSKAVSEANLAARYNYRLTTFTFHSLLWVHEGFYPAGIKVVPVWVTQYLSPLGLAH